MKLITVTNWPEDHEPKDIHINVESIGVLEPLEVGTLVAVGGVGTIRVKESADEIIEMMEE